MVLRNLPGSPSSAWKRFLIFGSSSEAGFRLELKKSLDLMCRRHSDSEEQIRGLSQALQRSQSELDGLSDKAEKWRVEHRNEVERLTRVIEDAKERNRYYRNRFVPFFYYVTNRDYSIAIWHS